MADPDPERVLKGWVGHIHPPSWSHTKSRTDCAHCLQKFKLKKHNCRICGKLFCSRCTQKFHLPVTFKHKKKAGATRVCYGCRNSVLEHKSSLLAGSSVEFYPPNIYKDKSARWVVHTPRWKPVIANSICFKCKEHKKHLHNCRCCGEVTCSDCSDKMAVPPKFHQKGKSGDVRVCDSCRWLHFAHAAFEETDIKAEDKLLSLEQRSFRHSISQPAPADLPPLPPPEEVVPPPPDEDLQEAKSPVEHEDDESSATDTGDSDSESDAAPPPPPAEPFPYESAPIIGAKSDSAPSMNASVRWEGLSMVLATIPGITEETSLKDLSVRLLQQRSELREKPFSFVFRGKAIPEEFFDVFTIKHLSTQIFIRGQGDIRRDVAAEAPQQKGIGSQVLDAIEAKKVKVEALYAYEGKDDKHLSFDKGDVLTLLNCDNKKWWYGCRDKTNKRGWIPSNYVAELISQAEPNRVEFGQTKLAGPRGFKAAEFGAIDIPTQLNMASVQADLKAHAKAFK